MQESCLIFWENASCPGKLPSHHDDAELKLVGRIASLELLHCKAAVWPWSVSRYTQPLLNNVGMGQTGDREDVK